MVGAGRGVTGSTLRAVSWVDVVIVVWVALAALRGRSLGALTQLFGLVGFVAGLAIGATVAVPIAGRLHADVVRTAVTAGVVLGAAILGGIGGNVLGRWANVSMRRLHLGAVDAVGGAAVAGLGALLSAWLVAGLFTQSSVGWLARPIQHSAVLTAIDAVMPPVPSVIARAQAFMSTEVFPAAFAAVTQPSTTSVQLPTQRAADALSARASRSVLQVVASGGCGVTRDGTSFVVAPGLVITNAHVVAGEPHVVVVTPSGSAAARLVSFDPSLDVAMLRVAGLHARGARARRCDRADGDPRCGGRVPGRGSEDGNPRGHRRRAHRPGTRRLRRHAGGRAPSTRSPRRCGRGTRAARSWSGARRSGWSSHAHSPSRGSPTRSAPPRSRPRLRARWTRPPPSAPAPARPARRDHGHERRRFRARPRRGRATPTTPATRRRRSRRPGWPTACSSSTRCSEDGRA